MSQDFEQERELERLVALTNLQRVRSQWPEAEETCRKAVEIAPGDVAIREMMGDIFHELGKLDAALSEYRAAMDLAPDRPALETKFAKVTLEIGERQRERELARDMLENPKKYSARTKVPLTAMLASLFVPGLGQLYNGELVKAGIVFGAFLLFVISVAAIPHTYPRNIMNISVLLNYTNPIVLLVGILAFLAWIYGIIDAPLAADKANKIARKSIEP